MTYECLLGHLVKEEDIVYDGGYGVCPICGDEDLVVIEQGEK